MTEENEHTPLAVKPDDESSSKTSLGRTVFSLLLFIAVYYLLFKSWFAVAALVSMLLIHEAGHFVAMKYFGYKGVNMTFVPFVGAYVTGTATNLSRKNKLIVLLAGPVPGIIIGCILLYMHHLTGARTYFQLSLPFLALNLFNLLPVFPLDGGQFFQTLFFHGSRILQLIFLYLSAAVMLFLFYRNPYYWFFLVVVMLLLQRINYVHFVNRVRKKLDAAGVDYACTYDDLTDDEYWQIRNIVITENRTLRKKFDAEQQSADEQQLIKHVENVLVPAYTEDLGQKEKLFFALLWLVSIAFPVWLWFYCKGFFQNFIWLST